MKPIISLLFLFLLSNSSFAQTNIRITDATASKILKGDYNPKDYAVEGNFKRHQNILCGLQKHISTDSLKSYLTYCETFHTRHTYSDTASNVTGIGAARRWAFEKFAQFSKENGNRLIPTYLEFDFPNGDCGDGYDWKNIIGVIPGIDTSDKSIIIVEAHFDSRCEVPCDANCLAGGMEDNGSGSALVLELARVMTRYGLNHTVVYMLTVGEEQGLYGAKAMAQYCEDNGIEVKAVLNNDVIGGIRCGETSSPPSCEGEGNIDSTQVRIFSNGGLSLPHRGLARTINIFYKEKLESMVDVPMDVSIMDQEDRTGRGGDHIPFRVKGYPSIRFTAANEHGHAHPDANYTDRQHSSRDVLGLDTNSDGAYDIYYVDFNYLKRNAVINGASTTLLGLGPQTPEFTVHDEATGLRVEITDKFTNEYRIGVRGLSSGQEFDAIYRTSQTTFVIPNLLAGTAYRISVSGIDNNGIMSSFSGEVLKINDVPTLEASPDNLSYQISCENLGQTPLPVLTGNNFHLSCSPNPNNGLFTITVQTSREFSKSDAEIVITDMTGREVEKLPFQLHPGMVEVKLDVALTPGQYIYSLRINGKNAQSKNLLVH